MQYDFAVGFAFSENLKDVVLIRKTHPYRLANKLNGPGGEFDAEEGDKDILDTMIREFKGETGITTKRNNWVPVTSFKNINGKTIQVFCAKGDQFLTSKTTMQPDPAKTEEIMILKTAGLSCRADLLPEVPEQIRLSMKILQMAIPKHAAA